MQMTGVLGAFYHFSEWGVRLVYVNLLWFIFAALGGGILGVFPATQALFSVTRHWLNGDETIPVLRTFWKSYREYFIRSNILGYLLLLLGFILWIDFQFIQTQSGIVATASEIILIGMLFMYGIVVMYIFPVYTHYRMNLLDAIKDALFIGVLHPFRTFLMMLMHLLIFYILLLVPGIIPFISVSLLSLIGIYMAGLSFKRIDMKRIV
ncbi:YesL family protein [Radiobacillus sp. PE A8.2]|uniref:YesL family protein n=1 Tax=Radiobacillus sp. PE A8.2 TaxID=3380349 RepID=UPI00388E1F35